MVFIYYINSSIKKQKDINLLQNLNKTYKNVIYINKKILYDLKNKKTIKELDFIKKLEYTLNIDEILNINIIDSTIEDVLTYYYILQNINKKFKMIINPFPKKEQTEYISNFNDIIIYPNIIEHHNTIRQILQTPKLKLLHKKFNFNIKNQHNDNYGFHRYGWEYVKQTLIDIENPKGITLDLFLEKTFIWEQDKNHIYTEPWVGFIHMPFNIPQYLIDIYKLPNILELDNFKESLKCCKGLIVLSEDSKDKLSKLVDVPVYNLKHPIPFGIQTFNMDNYNRYRRVVHIGYWLRNYSYFFNLKTEQHKILLEKTDKEYWLKDNIEKQKLIQMKSTPIPDDTIIEHKYFMENNDYDELLSASVAMAYMEDTSANNIVIECIQYSTPLLINKHPSLVEYLGEDYPFYYSTQEEADRKINDINLVEQTHNYLFNMNKNDLYINKFIEGLNNIQLDITNFYIGNQETYHFGEHRSGWKYVLSNIQHNIQNSIIHNRIHYLDTFLESTFVWGDNAKRNIYTQPWSVIIHNPPNIPYWFKYEQSFESILKNPNFIKSLPYLKNIITLSEYNAKYLRNHKIIKKYNIAIHVLYHPTDIPDKKFTIEAFENNNNKRVIQVGWWLRKLHSIFLLPKVYGYTKTALGLTGYTPKQIFIKENKYQFNNSLNIIKNDVELLERVNNDEYDDLLSKNIVFVELYDSSANNLVIECIARNTPILINPVGGVVDYLGKDYPFYFNTLEEASYKLQNKELIKETTDYLKNNKEINSKIDINNFYKNLNKIFN